MRASGGPRKTVIQRLTMVAEPAVAAFSDPARLVLRSWLGALRRDRRAKAGTIMAGALFTLMLAGALHTPPPGHARDALLGPSATHLLGTDELGRDVLSALISGAFPTLGLALLAVFGSGALGAALGALAGLLRGGFDGFLRRLLEVTAAVPSLLLVLVFQASLPRTATLLLVVVACRCPEIALVARADVMRVQTLDHVLAARSLGATPARILTRHVLPWVLSSGLVVAAFGVGSVVVLESAVAIVGVGNVHPLAWGALLGQARRHPEAWWLVAFPSLLVLLTVATSVLLGEAMRDTLEPKERLK